MSDGEDTASDLSHGELWRRIEHDPTRMYAIGLGEGMERYSLNYATRGRRLLQHLAIATDGASFFTTDSASLARFYGRIAEELSRPALYTLTPELGEGFGQLRLIATGEHVPSAAMPAIHVIMDVSGSMNGRLEDGRRRIDAGKAALFETLDGLPEGAPFAMHAYGLNVPESTGLDTACEDIETLQQLAPLERAKIRREIERLEPVGGTTPLIRSISRVVEANDDDAVLVVVTDGIEECESDPLAALDALKGRGLDRFSVNLIGFDLPDETATAMVKGIADAAGGRFYEAGDGAAVSSALRSATSASYVVRDATRREVERGTIGGEPIDVPPGVYTVEIEAAGLPIRIREVTIVEDHLTSLRVNKAGAEVATEVAAPRSLAEIEAERVACGEPAVAGDAAERARRIQEALNQLGFPAGPADNQPGPKTEAAVVAFIRSHGLDVPAGMSLQLEQHLDCVVATGLPYDTDGFLPASSEVPDE